MTVASSLTRTKTHIRCGSPDCDWGLRCPVSAKANGTGAGTKFREHCIERHGLDPNDGERLCWFDLALTMTLLG
jgi:hypothetical protein